MLMQTPQVGSTLSRRFLGWLYIAASGRTEVPKGSQQRQRPTGGFAELRTVPVGSSGYIHSPSLTLLAFGGFIARFLPRLKHSFHCLTIPFI